LSGAGSGVSPQTCASPSIVAALPYPLSLLSISGLNKEGDTVKSIARKSILLAF